MKHRRRHEGGLRIGNDISWASSSSASESPELSFLYEEKSKESSHRNSNAKNSLDLILPQFDRGSPCLDLVKVPPPKWIKDILQNKNITSYKDLWVSFSDTQVDYAYTQLLSRFVPEYQKDRSIIIKWNESSSSSSNEIEWQKLGCVISKLEKVKIYGGEGVSDSMLPALQLFASCQELVINNNAADAQTYYSLPDLVLILKATIGSQLQTLVLEKVEDESSSTEDFNDFKTLQKLKVCRCNLKKFSATTSNLTVLDLSHNAISNFTINSTLRSLNVSYNRIGPSIPLLSSQSSLIVWLNLKANKIESLSGIEALRSLKFLDLSCNRIQKIQETAKLVPLPLEKLYLVGNPIASHPDYRRQVCFYTESSRSLVLDDIPWNDAETSQICKRPRSTFFPKFPLKELRSVVFVEEPEELHEKRKDHTSTEEEEDDRESPFKIGLKTDDDISNNVSIIVQRDGGGTDEKCFTEAEALIAQNKLHIVLVIKCLECHAIVLSFAAENYNVQVETCLFCHSKRVLVKTDSALQELLDGLAISAELRQLLLMSFEKSMTPPPSISSAGFHLEDNNVEEKGCEESHYMIASMGSIHDYVRNSSSNTRSKTFSFDQYDSSDVLLKAPPHSLLHRSPSSNDEAINNVVVDELFLEKLK